MSVPSDRPVLGSDQGGRSVGFGDPLAQRASAQVVAGQPPCQGVQKVKCAPDQGEREMRLARPMGTAYGGARSRAHP